MSPETRPTTAAARSDRGAATSPSGYTLSPVEQSSPVGRQLVGDDESDRPGDWWRSVPRRYPTPPPNRGPPPPQVPRPSFSFKDEYWEICRVADEHPDSVVGRGASRGYESRTYHHAEQGYLGPSQSRVGHTPRHDERRHSGNYWVGVNGGRAQEYPPRQYEQRAYDHAEQGHRSPGHSQAGHHLGHEERRHPGNHWGSVNGEQGYPNPSHSQRSYRQGYDEHRHSSNHWPPVDSGRAQEQYPSPRYEQRAYHHAEKGYPGPDQRQVNHHPRYDERRHSDSHWRRVDGRTQEEYPPRGHEYRAYDHARQGFPAPGYEQAGYRPAHGERRHSGGYKGHADAGPSYERYPRQGYEAPGYSSDSYPPGPGSQPQVHLALIPPAYPPSAEPLSEEQRGRKRRMSTGSDEDEEDDDSDGVKHSRKNFPKWVTDILEAWALKRIDDLKFTKEEKAMIRWETRLVESKCWFGPILFPPKRERTDEENTPHRSRPA